MKQILKKKLEVSMSGVTRYLGHFIFAQIKSRISYFLATAAMSIYVLCGWNLESPCWNALLKHVLENVYTVLCVGLAYPPIVL